MDNNTSPLCGTLDGWYLHRKNKNEFCRLCKDARNARIKTIRAEKTLGIYTPKQRKKAVCGTLSGFVTHYKNKTEVCEPCKEANRLYWKSHRAKKAHKYKPENPTVLRFECGSYSGYQIHQRLDEAQCQDCRKAKNEYSANWNKNITPEQRDRNNANQRRRAHNNPEQRRAYAKKSRQKPTAKQKAIEAANRRRAQKLNTQTAPYTHKDVLEKWGVNCHICSEPIDLEASRRVGVDNWQNGLHLDHVVPLSNNGTDTLDNIKPAHALCNISKGNRSIDDVKRRGAI